MSTRIHCDQYGIPTATLALLRWITHLEQFSQITNQTKEDA